MIRRRFVLSLSLFALLYVAHAAEDLSYCKCWEGYTPKRSYLGVRCYSTLLLHMTECNRPKWPKCVCTGNVTSIMTDWEGTWCTEYANGKQLRKWECENKEEWDKFYELHPNEIPVGKRKTERPPCYGAFFK